MIPFICPEIDINAYKYRMEMHAHTWPASSCSEKFPAEVVKIYSDIGYDAVVLTNHIRPKHDADVCRRHVEDYEAAVEAAKGTGLKILFGVELTFPDIQGDYLIYGVEPADMPAIFESLKQGYRCLAASPERAKSIVFSAHPYRNDRIGAELYIPELSDGVESFNMHPCVNSENGFMTRTAYNENLLTICGSDYHHENHEGMSALLVKKIPDTVTELRDLLRSGDYLFEINGNVIIPSHRMIRKTDRKSV